MSRFHANKEKVKKARFEIWAMLPWVLIPVVLSKVWPLGFALYIAFAFFILSAIMVRGFVKLLKGLPDKYQEPEDEEKQETGAEIWTPKAGKENQ